MDPLQPSNEEQEDNGSKTCSSIEDIATSISRKKRISSQKNKNSHQLH